MIMFLILKKLIDLKMKNDSNATSALEAIDNPYKAIPKNQISTKTKYLRNNRTNVTYYPDT